MSETTPGATVHDLIRQREQLTGWIARLDEVGAQASTRAAERIRADYADRLRRVNESLSAHRGEIDADLQRFRGALEQAEQQRLAAADEMDEASLRHLIGELDEAAWNAARPELEGRVRDAEEAVAQARAEVERLETLAADIASAQAAAAAPPAQAAPAHPEPAAYPPDAGPAGAERDGEAAASPFDREAAAEFEPDLPDDLPGVDEIAAPAAAGSAFDVPPPVEERAPDAAAAADEWDPFGEEFGAEPKPSDAEEDLPWLEGIDQAATGQGWAPPAAAGDEGLEFLREIEESSRPVAEPAGDDLGADDLAFLEELDRAIGSGPGSTGRAPKQPPSAEPAAPPPAAASSGAGARAEPLLCKECGAINEPHSWYCEICGSEL